MGYIKLDREIQSHWVWENDGEPYSKGQAWVDLIMLANYKDNKTIYKGEVITCKRGDVNLSITTLAERWRWGRKKARTFLNALESDGMVVVSGTNRRTIITLVNYSKYQIQGTNEGTSQEQVRNELGTNQEQVRNTTNKNNKDKESKKRINNIEKHPTVEEVKKYVEEKGYHIDAEMFVAFYESKGWKVGKEPMKNWKSCVVTWEKRVKENNQGNKFHNLEERKESLEKYTMKF